MRPWVLGAGKRLATALGLGGVALLLAACTLTPAQLGEVGGASGSAAAKAAKTSPGAQGVANLLMARGVIPGGFSAPADLSPGRVGGGKFVKLQFPSALALSGSDLFVADSGLGALVRIDTMTQAVATLATLPRRPGVHLAAGLDGSVYVARPDRNRVDRLSREGRALAQFVAPREILKPGGLVVEPMMNRLWISDAAGGVFAFHPSGRMGEPIAGRGDGFASAESGATLLAAANRRVVGIDPGCRCVIEFERDGVAIGRFGAGQLINPSVLALDDFGRAWVMDRGDGRLKVFDGDWLAFTLTPGQLGMSDISAIAIDAQRVYIADGPGGKIGAFALLPPARRAQ